MRTEVCSAVDFISSLLRSSHRTRRCLAAAEIERFRQTLLVLLCTHYQDHWFPDRPFKGSGYRCIRINHKMDPLLSRAGQQCGFSEADLYDILPAELTLWVDPDEVAYRIGEEGSIAVFYESSDSETSASSGSPSPCPQDLSCSSSPVSGSPVSGSPVSGGLYMGPQYHQGSHYPMSGYVAS